MSRGRRKARHRTRRILTPLALIATLGATSGCSQVAQLRGVAGGQVSAVRTATNNVLVDKQVQIGVAPVCIYADPLYTCAGTTADGQKITSSAEVLAEQGATKDQYGALAPADVSLVVQVGGTTIYDGTVQSVLDTAGEVSR